MSQVLEYFEIDVPRCSLIFGVSPCTASGPNKCYNSLGTCLDRPNFDNEPVTLRFGRDTAFNPLSIEAFPALESVAMTPGEVSLGEDFGRRSILEVTLSDFIWGDTGPAGDKYLDERDYDPSEQGTFFGRFRPRNPYLVNAPVRWIRGLVGQTLEEMETRHYILESFDGPKPDGTFKFIAGDILKLADRDKALAPRPSSGYLHTAIDADDVVAVLAPTGIGDAEYPASGHLCFGGKEIVSFTRSGDNLTIVRGQRGTVAQEHAQEDRIQVVLIWDAQDPGVILADLLENYADVPSSYIPAADWLVETQSFLNRLYTATIPEPTPVAQLGPELIEQAGLAIWWDDIAAKLRLQVLRPIPTSATTFSEEIYEDIEIEDQPEKRLTAVLVYYGQVDPTKPLTNIDNYRSMVPVNDEQAIIDYGSDSTKRIFSRFIPANGRAIAEKVAANLLSRFRDIPRRAKFKVFRGDDTPIPALGGGYRFEHPLLQQASGERISVPIQVTRLKPDRAFVSAEAQEALYSAPADPDRIIYLEFPQNNVDLKAEHDSLYPEAESGDDVICYIRSGALLGSTLNTAPSFVVDGFASGVNISIFVDARVQARGGDGGDVGQDGEDGGTAFYVRVPVSITYQAGAEIYGGGGGGAGGDSGGGGGGAGRLPGLGGLGASQGRNGRNGTAESGGEGGTSAGDGGDPGEPGEDIGFRSGGAGGAAIDGISYVTVLSGTADIRGEEIN